MRHKRRGERLGNRGVHSNTRVDDSGHILLEVPCVPRHDETFGRVKNKNRSAFDPS
jgi:hypothetical protein